MKYYLYLFRISINIVSNVILAINFTYLLDQQKNCKQFSLQNSTMCTLYNVHKYMDFTIIFVGQYYRASHIIMDYLQALTPKYAHIILKKPIIFCKKIFILEMIHSFNFFISRLKSQYLGPKTI